MPKKRVSDSDVEVDDASDGGTPPSKRARFSATQSRDRKGKSRRQQEDSDVDENESDDEETVLNTQTNELIEAQFEQENADKIRATLDARRHIQGGIAEHGIIEHVEMHQFMCHKYLAFDFGPQINFIIGHNGSGKSAVLSAITVALGGKTASTGRGNGLKSFIREGQSVAEVTITLKNQGEEAYKPDVYGKSIMITRRFSKEGSSTWKIKNKAGHVVSTKKDELSAICDHMNIQVDNPMNVLTQDAARKFLSASHPKEKYDFFLKGTQLSQLHDEYQASMKNLAASNKILEQRGADLPELKAQYKEAENRYKEANAARRLKLEVEDLKKELAWSHVKTKEDELSAKVEALAKEENRLPRYQGLVTEAEASFDSASEQIAQFEDEYKELGAIEHLHQRRRGIQEEMRVNKNNLLAFVNDERQINSSLKAINRQIEEYDIRIEEETQKLAADTQSKRDEVQRRLDAAKAAVQTAEAKLKAIREDRDTLQAESDVAREEGSKLDRDIRSMQTNIQAQEAMVNDFATQKRDQFAAFGKNMDALVANIKKSRWHGDVPLGPLGVGVKVREDCKWATDVLRAQLGNILTAFAITNAKDMGPLKAMLQQSGNPSINVIIFEKDLFDFSRGEPPSDMLTVLRALEIPDPYALRIMINQLQIERTFLARTHGEADAMAKAVGGGVAWTQNAQRVAVFSGGGGQTTQLNKLKRGDPHFALLTGRDVAQDALHFKEELRRLEQEYASLQAQRGQIREAWTQMKHKITAFDRQEAAADAQLRNAKMTVDGIMQAMNDDLPANVAALEAAREAAVTEKDSVIAQFSVLVEQKNKIDALQAPLLLEQNRIKADIEEFDGKAASIKTKIQKAVEARMHAQQSKEHYKAKLEAHKQTIKGLEVQVQVLQEEFTDWTAKAEEFCPRVETQRTPGEIDRQIQGVTKTLRTREQKQGVSVEALTIERDKAKARYETVSSDINALSVMNKTLREAIEIRTHRWVEFRRHIALRCKYVFQYNLSHRGYFGKVLFDHVAQTLTLKVQTEDAMGTQGGQDKDPRSLSGGEKSFSTICLLLSLWESIGCPLRCLDEFDVFMDAVNRRISMKMMIDTANSSDKKQYILITPQDMTNVQLGPTVKVNRMPDPERGQIAS